LTALKPPKPESKTPIAFDEDIVKPLLLRTPSKQRRLGGAHSYTFTIITQISGSFKLFFARVQLTFFGLYAMMDFEVVP
jgi:hypothetical protein